MGSIVVEVVRQDEHVTADKRDPANVWSELGLSEIDVRVVREQTGYAIAARQLPFSVGVDLVEGRKEEGVSV